MPRRTVVSGQQPDAQKRKRVYSACTACRRRRRKCDGNEPCDACHRAGYSCVYGPTTPGDSSDQAGPSGPRHHRRTGSSRTADDHHRSPVAAAVIANPERGRFVATHSAVAVPHIVGKELGVANPLKLHSYAWNVGVRAEKRGELATRLTNYVDFDQCCVMSNLYFSAVHPIFPFLDRNAYFTRLQQVWPTINDRLTSFAAVVAGVTALGSFFSSSPLHSEEDIKQHCFAMLDLSLSTPAFMMDMEAVAGWMLRALYTRLTTRPLVACLASHNAIHMAGILSLHRDAPNSTSQRYYRCAAFLDALLSAEYGIAPASDYSNVEEPEAEAEDAHLVPMTHALQLVNDPAACNVTSPDITEELQRLAQVPDHQPVVSLFKAGVCLCILRRFVPTSSKPDASASEAAASILEQALSSANTLVASRHPWWNIVMVPFHVVCLAVSFDAEPYLSLLPPAMELLRLIVNTYDTKMTKEALSTALVLLKASQTSTTGKLNVKTTALAQEYMSTAMDTTWLIEPQITDIWDWTQTQTQTPGFWDLDFRMPPDL